MSSHARTAIFAPLLGAALLFSTPRAAQAHEGPTGFYFGGGGGAEWFSLPSVDAIIDDNRNPIGETDGSFWAETGFLTIGYVDGSGLRIPDPFGENARFEATVRYTHGDSDKGVDTFNPLGLVPINNPTNAADGSGGGFNTAVFETELESWDADLLYRTDVRLNGHVMIQPVVGIAYTHLEIDNDFTIFVNGFDFSALFDLDDEITTNYLGVVLGADLVVSPVDFLSLTLGLRADLMGASSRLGASQTFATVFPPNENRETDRDVGFASRTTVKVGAAVRFGMFELGVDGFARYHSYMPTAAHPTQDGFSGAPHRTSHIDARAAWSTGAMARLTIQLP